MLHIVTRRAVLIAVLLAGIGITSAAPAQQPASDPLPSWNDGTAKRAITDFVARVTLESSPEFVPAPERSQPSTTTARCGPSSRSMSSSPLRSIG